MKRSTNLVKVVKRSPHSFQLCVPKLVAEKVYLPVGKNLVWSLPLSSNPVEAFFKTSEYITGFIVSKNGKGGSISVTLPPKVVTDLNLDKGDALHVSVDFNSANGYWIRVRKIIPVEVE